MSEVTDFIGGLIAFYYSDVQAGNSLRPRRYGQIIALAEVLRFIEGDPDNIDERLSGYVPMGLDDLPRHLGGRR